MGVLGVSEVKKKGTGVKTLDHNYVLRYAGVPWGSRAKEGVGVIVSEEMDRKVISWEAVNSRLVTVDLELDQPITLIQAYAPTEDMATAEKEEFFETLQKQIEKVESRRRKPIIMGDLNGRVGDNWQNSRGTLGHFAGESTLNSNGNRIIDLCLANGMLVANSFYKHLKIHQITFESTQHASIIDYFLLPRELKKLCRDVKVVRGAELSTDHYLLVADMVFTCGRRRKRTGYQKLRWEQLNDTNLREEYQEKLQEKLGTNQTWQDEIEERWLIIKAAILQACEEVCGLKMVKEGTKSTKWWNEEVKAAVADKKHAWKKWKQTRGTQDREE